MAFKKFLKKDKEVESKADDQEVAHLPVKEKAVVKEAAPKAIVDEKPPVKEVKKEKAPKKELTPKEKAKIPFHQLDPKDPSDNKEIIRRRNMGFN